MFNRKRGTILLTLLCFLTTAVTLYLVSRLDPAHLQQWLRQSGLWAPLIYIALYIVFTLFLLPSTTLNLTGGAIFGFWFGTLWTSVGAVLAAIVAFGVTRAVGRKVLQRSIGHRWQGLEQDIQQNGFFYIFAIRLLPIIPYGLVNVAAGLTAIRFKNYLFGTILGTVPGVFPFVWIGSSGVMALRTGDVLPLFLALSLTSLLFIGAIVYRRHSRSH